MLACLNQVQINQNNMLLDSYFTAQFKTLSDNTAESSVQQSLFHFQLQGVINLALSRMQSQPPQLLILSAFCCQDFFFFPPCVNFFREQLRSISNCLFSCMCLSSTSCKRAPTVTKSEVGMCCNCVVPGDSVKFNQIRESKNILLKKKK